MGVFGASLLHTCLFTCSERCVGLILAPLDLGISSVMVSVMQFVMWLAVQCEMHSASHLSLM